MFLTFVDLFEEKKERGGLFYLRDFSDKTNTFFGKQKSDDSELEKTRF